MGIRSPISKNYAMILGGLREGVSPLDMAHAYETFAAGGNRVFNPVLGAPKKGPTGIAELQCYQVKCDGKTDIKDHPSYERILPPAVAAEVHDILTGPVSFGTATSAQIPGVDVVGKTGTTSDYADAWFVGWTPQMTTAVWVGYPTSSKSMATLYNGSPVEGGTYPAIIWQSFMTQALQILANEAAKHPDKSKKNGSGNSGNSGSRHSGVGSHRVACRALGAEQRSRFHRQHRAAGNTGGGGAGGNTGGGRRWRRWRRTGNSGGGGGGGGDRQQRRRRRWRRRDRQQRRWRRRRWRAAAPAARRHRRQLSSAAQAGHGAGGRGTRQPRRETNGLPVTPKRHGRSAALVIPIRSSTVIAGSRQPDGRSEITIGPSMRSVPLCSSSMPSACVSLPGPEQSAVTVSIPRRARIASIPRTGSSARMSTAAPTPSGSHTALSSAWIP